MELYNITRNGTPAANKPLNRSACLIRLERARAQSVIAGYTYTWRGSCSAVKMAISNGDTWVMEAV